MQSGRQDSEASGTNSIDEIIAIYKLGIDQTLLQESLALTPDQRVRRLVAFLRTAEELRRAMKAAPQTGGDTGT